MTWPFGKTAVTTAANLLRDGKSALDAALAGAQDVEDDPKVHSVGFAGLGIAGYRRTKNGRAAISG